MVSTLPLVVERPRSFPAVVEGELDRRRSIAAGRGSGRILDLDRPEARAEVARASVERQVVPAYDRAVSVAQLVRFPDLVAALRGIERLVEPGGELFVVEPDARPGLLALLVATIWARAPWTSGLHLNRDVTGAIRSTAFVLDDIERFTMPTLVSPLHDFVEVHAVRVDVLRPSGTLPVEATR